MNLTLGKLYVGKVDGKHEYLVPQSERDHAFFDAYLVPENISAQRINNSDIFYVEGFRGTGKTSLLRWHAEHRRRAGDFVDFILFKSDLTEQQRIGISQEVGIVWADIDSKKMEVSQDFKSAWRWFIHHKIGEMLIANPTLASSGDVEKYVRLLGLKDPNIYTKVLGFLPKLEGASIKVKSDVEFFEIELSGDFKKEGTAGKTTLDALCRKLDMLIRSIVFIKGLYLYFDELEVFYHSHEQYHRDQRMVRDLLFAVSSLNDIFRERRMPIHIVAAVRSEVIDGMGALGQEVDRIVHDRGFNIAWHYARRSTQHPLFQIIRRKVWASEDAASVPRSEDPILSYFPSALHGQSLETYLLDGSFWKPRDIVWRLTVAQKQFPHSTSFDEEVLSKTEIEYSSKLWDEIKYELSAIYSENEVAAIEMVLSGSSVAFELRDIEDRFEKAEEFSGAAKKLVTRRSVREILDDLYRLGAIGNSFRVGATGTDIRNRWVFRGDPSLLPDKRIVIHQALTKRLSAVAQRRRGVRGGANR